MRGSSWGWEKSILKDEKWWKSKETDSQFSFGANNMRGVGKGEIHKR